MGIAWDALLPLRQFCAWALRKANVGRFLAETVLSDGMNRGCGLKETAGQNCKSRSRWGNGSLQNGQSKAS